MQENKKEIRFEKLTPTGNVNLRVYEPAIDFAFKEKDINNIAITGAYGVGKSSVLEAYKKRHKEWSFLHVSMTNFEEEDKDKVVAKIEGNIINQLIHQISPNVIDQTKFRRKEKLCKEKVIRDLWIPFAAILLLAIFIYSKYWYSDKVAIDIETINSLFIFASSSLGTLMLYSLIVFMMFLIIYKVYILQVNKNVLKKIKIQGNEIELFQRDNDEYFDRYLNEIIFMITNSDVDIFVFEDIDRFNDKAIIVFEKLREINRIVNIKKRGNKKVVFLYLVRDDLLTAAERTKFFDYIIPIVPILSGNNAYDKLIEFLSPDVDYKDFDRQFLRKSTFFIDDMRVLKSISNEFKVYYKMMDIKVNINKMMAIIMYKNLFPQDFSELRKRSGYVNSIFKEKEKTANAELTRIKNERDVLDMRMRKNFRDNGYKNREEDITKYKEYEHRIELLETAAPLHKIITRENQGSFFKIEESENKKDEFKEIKESSYFGLIKYFIMSGYIDEKYGDYLTVFYGNSITVNDKNYIMSVISKESIDMNYKLDNPEHVIDELSEYDFTQEETKNLDLLDFLLINQKFKNYLEKLIIQLKNSKDFKFINEYIDKKDHLTEFTATLLTYWSTALVECINNISVNEQEENAISEESMRKLSIVSLCDEFTEGIDDQICSDKHLEYISKHKNYVHDDNKNIDKIVLILKDLDIKFEDITCFGPHFLSQVYKYDMYKLNFENIKAIIWELEGMRTDDELKHMNYTKIMNLYDDTLINYIKRNGNINEYMESILDNCDKKIVDCEIAALDIINSDKLTEDKKNKYIECLNENVISEIKSVTDVSLWDLLLIEGCIKDDSRNIYEYYSEKFELTDALVEYINKFHNVICMPEEKLESEGKFIEEFIHRNGINDKKYKEILEISDYKITDFYQSDYSSIDKNKIYILIETDTLQVSEDNSWVCENLVESKELKRETKIAILVKNICAQNEDSIRSMLDKLSLGEYKRIFDKKTRPRFTVKEENRLILDAFAQGGFIENYSIDERNPRYYRIYRKKSRQIK